MKYLFSTKIRIVLVAVVLIAAALAVIGNLTGYTAGDMFVKGILAPLRAGASSLTDQAENIYDYLFKFDSLAAENESLKAQLAELQEGARDVETIQRENDRLRELLELKKNNPSYEMVDAYIITRSSAEDWNKTVTINRGTNSGIEVGMCAITSNGEVVGKVFEVGTNYAVIKTVLDSSLEISATIASTGYNGMVKGGYTSDLDGLLRMDYLPSSSVIRNKDQVVTAGSTSYPRNLILGYVIDAGYNDTGVAKFAVLQPAADIESLEQVFVLTSFTEG